MHWTVGYATAVGLARIREFWLPELRNMGVKWVKIFNHDGAIDFCELLLAEGFMPIVRLYRPNPNPGRLGVKELVRQVLAKPLQIVHVIQPLILG